eukprot:TRINITY_DN5414_c0_g2_i2.p1 TRINITY_DN5414_c0_g2~~TRINITY_DN5414_c0_g2_i2.p1  ORF type:complete len:1429 (+),score=207.13 TRINITY_DN5414_c0_g2_i2:118-4404(+)
MDGEADPKIVVEEVDPWLDGQVVTVRGPYGPEKADTSDRGLMFDVRARGALSITAIRVGTELGGQGPVILYTCKGSYGDQIGLGEGVWKAVSEPVVLPVMQERRIPLLEPLWMRAGSTRGFLVHGRSDGAVAFRLQSQPFYDDFVMVLPGDYIGRGGISVKADAVRRNATLCGSVDYILSGCAVDGCQVLPGGNRWMQFCGRHAGIPISCIAGAVAVVGTLPWKWTAALQHSAELAAAMPPAPADPTATPDVMGGEGPDPLRIRQSQGLQGAPCRALSNSVLPPSQGVSLGPNDSDGTQMLSWIKTLRLQWALLQPAGSAPEAVDVVCMANRHAAPFTSESEGDAVEFQNEDPVAAVRMTKIGHALRYSVDGSKPRPPTRDLEWIPPRILRFKDIRRHAKLPSTNAHAVLSQIKTLADRAQVKHNITDRVIDHATRTSAVFRVLDHRGRGMADAVPRCCMQQDFVTVCVWTQIVLLTAVEDSWTNRLLSIPPGALVDSVVAARLFSSERLDPATGLPRATQLCSVLTRAMQTLATLHPDRPVPVRRQEEVEAARSVLLLMKPLTNHLNNFLRAVKDDCINIVVRGTPGAFAHHYALGDDVVWPAQSAASTRGHAATEAARCASSGTVFVIQGTGYTRLLHVSGAFDSSEVLIPEPQHLRVVSRLHRRLLMLVGTRGDVVSLHQPSMLPASAEDNVDLALASVSESRFIYDRFLHRYVEPLVAEERAEEEELPSLGSRFDRFLASEFESVLLLSGNAHTGRSSLSLAMMARLLDTPGAHVPVFTPIPDTGSSLLDPDESAPEGSAEIGLLAYAILKTLHLSASDLPALKKRRLCVFLDALDETHHGAGKHAPAALLAAKTLLPRGGIDVTEWPRTKWVVTSHSEYLSLHGIGTSHIFPPSKVKYVRLVPLLSRNPKFAQGTVQLGCMQVFDKVVQLRHGPLRSGKQPTADWTGAGNALEVASADCTDWCPRGEEAYNAAAVNSKRWRALRCPLVFELREPASIQSYRLQTADDPSDRDIVSWQLDGSDSPAGPWHLLDARGTSEAQSPDVKMPDVRWAWTSTTPCTASPYTAVRIDVAGFTPAQCEAFVQRSIAAEVELFAERIRGGGSVSAALANLRCPPPPKELIEYVREAQDELELSDACRRCTATAVLKAQALIKRVGKLHPQLVQGAFTLHMLIHVTDELQQRWYGNEEALKAAKWELYQVWLIRVLRTRLASCHAACSVIQDAQRLLQTALSALMRIAVRAFTSPRPQATVADCLLWLRGDEEEDKYGEGSDEASDQFQRALLSCLPLVCEDFGNDSMNVTFRHISIRDQQVAAALASVDTPCDIWYDALSGRSLDAAPPIIAFFLERMRTGTTHDGRDVAQAASDLLEAFTAGGERSSLRSHNARQLIGAARNLVLEGKGERRAVLQTPEKPKRRMQMHAAA